MNNVVKTQIFAIRDTAETNLLDLPNVRKIALREKYYELLDFLDENRAVYIRFILYGDKD